MIISTQTTRHIALSLNIFLIHLFLLPPPPSVTEIGSLCASLIASSDMLFLITNHIHGSTTREWSLVRVALRDSIPLHPNTLQDETFLVLFLICHPGGAYYDVINQQYWLEYHPKSPFVRPEHE